MPAKEKEKFNYTVVCIENGQTWSINNSEIQPHWLNAGDIIIVDNEKHMYISKSLDLDSGEIILYVKD